MLPNGAAHAQLTRRDSHGQRMRIGGFATRVLLSRAIMAACEAPLAAQAPPDNWQLGSRRASAGQAQIRVEADYVTCTQ